MRRSRRRHVELVVDADYRTRLSVGHTACHLASLALNRAVADRWKKEVRADGLGAPDFDGTAIDVSLIVENGSVDTYRLGKSLRKRGFVTEGIAEALPDDRSGDHGGRSPSGRRRMPRCRSSATASG